MDLFLNKIVNKNKNCFQPIRECNQSQKIISRNNPINFQNQKNDSQQCKGFQLIDADSQRNKNNFNSHLPLPGFINNPFLNNRKKNNENNLKPHHELIKKRSYNELNPHSYYPLENIQKKYKSFTKIQGSSLTSNCSPKPLKSKKNQDGIFFSNQKYFMQNSTNGSNIQHSRNRSKGESNYVPQINSSDKSLKMLIGDDHKILKSLKSELKEISQLKISNDEFRQKMIAFVSKWNHILANNPINPRYPSIDFL
jgi:hypothetical protein